MSKKLIAGAGVVASFAVALAPLATFATVAQNASDQHTDELVVTVLPSCTFGSASKDTSPYPSGIEHDGSTGNYGANAADSSYAAGGKISATAWNTTQTTEASASVADSDEGGHNADDVASTGYGINGEGGVLAANENASEHTVHRSMLAGTTTDTFAQTTMWVVCNNGDGYTVTATAVALEDGAQTSPKTIPVNGSYSASSSGYTLKTIVAGNNGMTVASNVEALSTYSNTTIASKAGVSAENGDSLTVTYGMGIASAQEADTYAGKVTYKLYKGVNGS
ncbi:hypothetical protein IJI72_01545 [Candidatus Saccharibacteria bacterium]|nr:hypothetical protein [Candidatus Saccharibacteria bacterium]